MTPGGSGQRAPLRGHLGPGWYGPAAGPQLPSPLVSPHAALPGWKRPPPGLHLGTAQPAQRSGEGLARASLPLLAERSGGCHAEFRFLWLRPLAGGEAGRACSWHRGSAPSPRRTSGLLPRGGLRRPCLPFWAMVQPEGASVPRRC